LTLTTREKGVQMSVVNAQRAGARNHHGRTSETHEITGTSPALPAGSDELVGGPTSNELSQLVAYVLARARRRAAAENAPDDARAILNVAYSFADELSGRDPGFDRVQFIGAVVGGP
jgi:hypothetical protein